VPRILHVIKFIILSGCVLALCLNGCAGVSAIEDPRTVEEVVSRAEQLITSKAYAAAASQYAIAIAKQPAVGRYYLRRAELLERIDEDKEAHRTYQQAIKIVPDVDPDHLQIMHRLALINANHLFKLDDAETLLQRMPGASIERYDLAAFLYYQASQYDESITLLNKALERVKTADQKALLLYHAALVYVKLGDQKNTFGSLYYAINNAEHLGLIRDIEQLWQVINEEPADKLYRSPQS
jgi:tetratricopeptide (TPR) repeat protein